MADFQNLFATIYWLPPDVEAGTIVLWSGSVVDIPATWALCDGTNGTPDLRNRFIVGSGATYAVGASGGTIWHSHTVSMAIHRHDHLAGTGLAAGTAIDKKSNIGDTLEYTTDTNALPPYYSLCYIMKL